METNKVNKEQRKVNLTHMIVIYYTYHFKCEYPSSNLNFIISFQCSNLCCSFYNTSRMEQFEVLTKTRKDLKRPTTSMRRPETNCDEQETTRNDTQQLRYNLKGPEPTNKEKKRRETANNRQILQ